MLALDFRNPTRLRAIVLGGLGGIALILVEIYSSRGPLIFLPYAALLAALAALVGWREPAFKMRFVAVLAGFMTASLLLYVYADAFGGPSASSPSVSGHIARVALLLGIGSVLAAAVSYVTSWPTKRNAVDRTSVAA